MYTVVIHVHHDVQLLPGLHHSVVVTVIDVIDK